MAEESLFGPRTSDTNVWGQPRFLDEFYGIELDIFWIKVSGVGNHIWNMGRSAVLWWLHRESAQTDICIPAVLKTIRGTDLGYIWWRRLKFDEPPAATSGALFAP